MDSGRGVPEARAGAAPASGQGAFSPASWRERAVAAIGHPWFLPLCFLVHVLPRALILAVPVVQTSDAEWYLARAVEMAAGGGYAEAGHPTAYWPVGYPGFLALLFKLFEPAAHVGQIANLVLSAGTFFVCHALGRHLFGSETAARLGVLLLAVYPNGIGYTGFLMSEIPYTFLVLAGWLLYIRRPSLWAGAVVGLAFGVATLVKPQSLFLPSMLIAVEALSARTGAALGRLLVRACVVHLALAAALAPWAARNYDAFGAFVLVSTNGGIGLWNGNNPSADGAYPEKPPFPELVRWSIADQVAADNRARDLAVRWIKDNPGAFVRLMPAKVWNLWALDGEAEWSFQSGYRRYDEFSLVFRGVRVLNQGFYLLLLLGFAASLACLIRRRLRGVSPHVWFGLLNVAYATAIAAVMFGWPRYHFPVMPFIAMHAAWMLAVWLGAARPAAGRGA
jgi:hypothetical protein